MQLDVGKIYEGKVTGITKFGAFVEIEPGTTGMVHISEVANTFVSEIKDHLTEGQSVKVRYLFLSKRRWTLPPDERILNEEEDRDVPTAQGSSHSRKSFRRPPRRRLRICLINLSKAPTSVWEILKRSLITSAEVSPGENKL